GAGCDSPLTSASSATLEERVAGCAGAPLVRLFFLAGRGGSDGPRFPAAGAGVGFPAGTLMRFSQCKHSRIVPRCSSLAVMICWQWGQLKRGMPGPPWGPLVTKACAWRAILLHGMVKREKNVLFA